MLGNQFTQTQGNAGSQQNNSWMTGSKRQQKVIMLPNCMPKSIRGSSTLGYGTLADASEQKMKPSDIYCHIPPTILRKQRMEQQQGNIGMG